ncbi:hypothetical protein MOQ_005558 [Trypanosoma cruzi marinkellei]|uniref:Uncharacterized protein n=1 Tax=Trypanosoma cruzi marinkellei TaxID=85056 RepID=K2MXX2_TRYCR|nr:hypothetical protein MOQ_005558 [Trypanosoma cruzi marinkellei]
MSHANSTLLLVIILFGGLLLFTGTSNGQRISLPRETHSRPTKDGINPATMFLRWAQFMNSFVETLINAAGPSTTADKLKRRGPTDMESSELRPIAIPPNYIRAYENGEITRTTSPREGMKYTPPPKRTLPSHSCWSGYLAVPFNTTFNCSSDGNKTAVEYSNMTEYNRAKCQPDAKAEPVCICPIGTVWVKRRFDKEWVCYPRLLLVSVRLEDKHICQDSLGKSLGLSSSYNPSDYCIHTRRNAKLILNINVSYRWTENDELTEILTATNTLIVFGNLRYDEKYITLFRGISGTPDALSRSPQLFQFEVTPNASHLDAFGVVEGHPLQRDSAFEHVVYPFRDMALLYYAQVVQKLSESEVMSAFFSGDHNFTLRKMTRDLNRLSDSYVTSGMMYMEIGFYGPGIPFGARHSHLWITFKDPLPTKGKYNYDQSPSPAIIAAIAFASAVLVVIAVAVICHLCQRQKEIDDPLLANALDKQCQMMRKKNN